jgi:hypothetical protein
MTYFKCARCEYISKQKIDMKRHLEKIKKCKILNNSDNKSESQLYFKSLTPYNIDCGLDLNIEIKEKDKKFLCEKCNLKCSSKSNLNKHMKNSQRCKNNYEENLNNIQHNTLNNTTINNIAVQNNAENIIQNNIVNNININVKSLRGFEEDWNISNITDEMRKNLLLSDTRFTNTLRNILENDENLNVILKDESTGIIYKFKSDEYEAMHVKDILQISMDKIYKHLRDFLNDAINIDKKDNKIIMKQIDDKYFEYTKNLKIKKDVNSYLSEIFNDNKNKSVEKFIEKLDEKKDDLIIGSDIKVV